MSDKMRQAIERRAKERLEKGLPPLTDVERLKNLEKWLEPTPEELKERIQKLEAALRSGLESYQLAKKYFADIAVPGNVANVAYGCLTGAFLGFEEEAKAALNHET